MNKSQFPLPLNNIETPAKVWRPIHYLGSKLRMAEALRLTLDQMDPTGGRLLDLFSGSGTVSAAVAGTRDVTAADIQEYSRVLCSAVLNPIDASTFDVAAFRGLVDQQARANIEAAASLIAHEEFCLSEAAGGSAEGVCELIDHASMLAFETGQPSVSSRFALAHRQTRQAVARGKHPSVILRFYGGLYFSYKQAAELDALLTIAHGAGVQRDVILAAIISTASEVVNTVGKHFAQPIRPRTSDGQPKRHLIAKIVRDRATEVIPLFQDWLARYLSLEVTGRDHKVIRGDYADVLSEMDGVSVVYADPPYTRDHYSRFYHVLETMCRWDDPGVSTTRIRAKAAIYSRGMYRADRYQSPFCIKSQAPGAFEKLFAGVKRLGAPLVLSYSPFTRGDMHPRVMGVDQICEIAKRYFKDVQIESAGKFSHMKLNTTRLHLDASAEAEVMFLCR